MARPRAVLHLPGADLSSAILWARRLLLPSLGTVRFWGSEAWRTPDYTGRIAELERLTVLLTQQRDRMAHADDRQFAEVLLQSAMAKVCALKAQSVAPAPALRAT
jgi:hypothetical protein